MEENSGRNPESLELWVIDWADVACALSVGVVYAFVKVAKFIKPDWHIDLSDSIVPFLMTIGYIIARARRHPEKLDAWGITNRLTMPALAAGFALLAMAVGYCAVYGAAAGGGVTFEPFYVPRMFEYLVGAFPQQFFLCSVGLVSLAALRPFRGAWRLPLTIGIVFCLAHVWLPGPWSPSRLTKTLSLIPMGFGAAWYFLRFRNILPLTAIHAIVFVLSQNWFN